MFVEDHIKHSLSWLAATGFKKPPIYKNDAFNILGGCGASPI
jgi:hypothetical protein